MRKKRRKFQFKISQKLAVSCIGLCLAVISILSIQYYNYSRQLLETQTRRYISDMLLQTGNNLNLLMADVETLIFNLQKEPDVQNYLTRFGQQQQNTYEEYLAIEELRNTIYKNILFDENVEAVIIVPDQGPARMISKTMKDYQVDHNRKNNIYDAGGSAVWLGANPSDRYLTVGAQVNSLKTMKPLGYLLVQISERKFSDVLEGLSFVRDGNIFIVNQDNMIVSGNNTTLLNQPLDPDYVNVLDDNEDQIFQVIANGHQEKYLTYQTLANHSWNLMAVIPVISYQHALLELKRYFAIIFGIAAIVSAVISVLNTLTFSRPVKRLLQAMQDFGEGDFNVISNVTSSDEIGLLSQNFNRMVYNINDLIDKVYAETMLKQEAELKSLRMQINPHFLYNTLETINWLSREKGVDEVGEMAKSLGDMMYYTINGSDFTSVKDEVINIRNYLMIQGIRYGDRISFDVDIPEQLYAYKLPKLILQPLIENAIIHGLENREEGGRIIVHGMIKNKMLQLSVADNGVGMSQEKIRTILSQDSNDSIGIRNVNQRLQLYFGTERGLKIQSIENVGTEVLLAIPVGDKSE